MNYQFFMTFLFIVCLNFLKSFRIINLISVASATCVRDECPHARKMLFIINKSLISTTLPKVLSAYGAYALFITTNIFPRKWPTVCLFSFHSKCEATQLNKKRLENAWTWSFSIIFRQLILQNRITMNVNEIFKLI